MKVVSEMRTQGTVVREVSCLPIPGEEMVFSVYDGPSDDAIRLHNERAGILISRIVEATAVMIGSGPETSLTKCSGEMP